MALPLPPDVSLLPAPSFPFRTREPADVTLKPDMAPGAIKAEDKPGENRGASKEGQATFNASTVELDTKGSSAGAGEGLGAGKTFARQSELPKLPVPALEDTCKRYLTSLQPLQVRRASSSCDVLAANTY